MSDPTCYLSIAPGSRNQNAKTQYTGVFRVYDSEAIDVEAIEAVDIEAAATNVIEAATPNVVVAEAPQDAAADIATACMHSVVDVQALHSMLQDLQHEGDVSTCCDLRNKDTDLCAKIDAAGLLDVMQCLPRCHVKN